MPQLPRFSCAASAQSAAGAHALAQRYDLPLPLGFFLLAAGAAVAGTFVILAFAGRRPKLAWSARSDTRTRQPSTRRCHCRADALVALLFLIVAAGLFGHQNPFKNLAPVAVWVIWWVGLALLSAFVGNVWVLLNPFAALFGFVEWLAERCDRRLSLGWPYPARLGAWPACLLLLVFAWLELVAPGRDVPRNIAIAILIYSALTFAGFAAFGREVVAEERRRFFGDVRSVRAFCAAAFQPRAGLALESASLCRRIADALSAGCVMVAFTLLVLGTVTVDGFMETPLWASVVEQLFAAANVEPGIRAPTCCWRPVC